MNIAFFLIPKNEVAYMPLHCTMRQALEKMEYHRYTAVPLIDECGKYAGTITEGDFLWKMKKYSGVNVRRYRKSHDCRHTQANDQHPGVHQLGNRGFALFGYRAKLCSGGRRTAASLSASFARREIIEHYAKGGG